jgi:molybdopterin-guanine dinucleotide biosynthesis protein A
LTVNCYVLTGGRSTRMGRSKAELFLDQIVAAAAPVFERVIAVERFGASPTTIDTIFEDEHEVEGPVFGVARALIDAPGPCFILAVDFPLLRADVLAYLRTRFESSNASMLVPVWDGVPQVLCAGYRTCVAAILAERIESARLDLQGLDDDVDIEIVAEPELRARFQGEPLKNVNTPAELAAAERMR